MTSKIRQLDGQNTTVSIVEYYIALAFTIWFYDYILIFLNLLCRIISVEICAIVIIYLTFSKSRPAYFFPETIHYYLLSFDPDS